MAVRHFDGVDDLITVAPGALAGMGTTLGAITVAAIWRASVPATAMGIVRANNAGGVQQWAANPYLDGNTYFTVGSFEALNTYTDGEWYLMAWSKDAGTSTPRRHKYTYSTSSWEHVNGASPMTTNSNGPTDHVWIGKEQSSAEFLNGDVAVIGVWDEVLSDFTIESLTTRLANWSAASPTALWAFNQETVAEAVTDLTGGGANQTAITGTAVVEGNDPPGFSFGGVFFTPPVADGVLMYDPAKVNTDRAHALWEHYGAWAMGKTVWKDQAGVWHESLYPYQGGATHVVFEYGAQISSTGPDEGLATAQKVYHGGHTYELTPEEEADLIAAGYGGNITP